MTIQDFAILPENKSGFWIQKQYGEDGHCTYLVFHQRMTEFCDSISEAKQKLRDRYTQYLALRRVSDALYSRAMNHIAIRPLVPPRNYEGKKDRDTREQQLKKQGCDRAFIEKWSRKND